MAPGVWASLLKIEAEALEVRQLTERQDHGLHGGVIAQTSRQ